MAGRNPSEAVHNFLGPLQRAVSCVTNAVFSVGGGYHPATNPHVLVLNDGDPVRLKGDPRLSLSVQQQYSIMEAEGDRGPWKVTTEVYIYSLRDENNEEVIAYHYHPQVGVDFPHVHIRSDAQVGPKGLHKCHLPTGRVALEEVLRLAIDDLAVVSIKPDWKTILADTQGAYESYRTWPGSKS